MASYTAPESLHVGTGVETVFGFNWPYLLPTDLLVTLNGVGVPTVLASPNQVVVNPAPAAGVIVRILRNTPAQNPTYLFATGIPMLPKYIDGNNKQLLYALQEGLLEFAAVKATAEQALSQSAQARQLATSALNSSNRAFRAHPTDPIPNPVPPVEARRGKVAGFDGNGDMVPLIPASGSALDLAVQLANDAEGEGAEMVGWKRRPLSSAISSVAEFLNASPVSLWEFANLVTVKPTLDPSTWDWTQALAAWAATGGLLVLPVGTYNTSQSVALPSNTHVVLVGTLRFANQAVTVGADHLITAGRINLSVENVAITGYGTLDGNRAGRKTLAPQSGAYLFLGYNVTNLTLRDFTGINGMSTAVAGVRCHSVKVMDLRIDSCAEHGVYFSTESTRLSIQRNFITNAGIGGTYSADAIKLRNACQYFDVTGNTVGVEHAAGATVRGIVIDDSDNVSPIVHTVCRNGVLAGNIGYNLSTGIWIRGNLVDEAAPDALLRVNITVSGNKLAGTPTSLFAVILDRVLSVDIRDNELRNFAAGVYGGGVGEILIRDNTIKHRNGSTGYGVRMVDSNYNNLTVPSRKRGAVDIIGNTVDGYNGGGIYMAITDGEDKISDNTVISAGRPLQYVDLNLSTSPTSGTQLVRVTDNPLLRTTGASTIAVQLNAKAGMSVQYTVTGNTIDSPSTGVGFSVVQASVLTNNVIRAAVPFTAGSGADVYRAGNTDGTRQIAVVINSGANVTLTAADSGATVLNTGATLTRTHFLPPAVPGAEFTSIRTGEFPLRVLPQAGEAIRGGGAGKYLSLNSYGASVTLRCSISGVWEPIIQGTTAFEP